MNKPSYDFDHKVFLEHRLYIRYAKEHLSLASINSNVIKWEVKETVTPLNIPVVYHIHYYIRSIIGIDKDEMPIYGNHHIMELTIPPKYPQEGAKLYMKTDAWHPNIKSEGAFKGKICGNTKGFGKTFDFSQLVLWVGEILQYKNYHALPDVAPFPEDAKVAEWVLKTAEVKGIVDKEKGIYVDDLPLLMTPEEIKTKLDEQKIKETRVEEPIVTMTEIPKIKMKIFGKRTIEEPSQEGNRKKIVINKKND